MVSLYILGIQKVLILLKTTVQGVQASEYFLFGFRVKSILPGQELCWGTYHLGQNVWNV